MTKDYAVFLTEHTVRQSTEIDLFLSKISSHIDTVAALFTSSESLLAYSITEHGLIDSLAIPPEIETLFIELNHDIYTYPRPPSLETTSHIRQKLGQENAFGDEHGRKRLSEEWLFASRLMQKGAWGIPSHNSQEETIISYGAPFYKEADVKGVVAATVSIKDIAEKLNAMTMKEGKLVLLNHLGTILVHPDENYIMRHTLMSFSHETGNQELLDLSRFLSEKNEAGISYVRRGFFTDNEYIAYAPITGTGWMLLSIFPEAEIITPIWKLTFLGALLFFIVGMGLLFIIIYFLESKSLLHPLLKLEEMVTRYSKGERDVRIEEKSPIREIYRIQRAFNRMTEQLNNSLAKEINTERARIYAEETSHAKTEFLARMSHEVRTPMNAILGLSHLALKEVTDNRQRSFLEKIERSGKTMLSILNDILDFSKIEAGHLKLETIPFRPREIAQEIKDMFQSTAEEKKLIFSLTMGDTIPDWLVGDPLRVTQILMNLCSNAFKFTKDGGVEVHISIDKNHSLNDAMNCALLITVQDTGIGISPEMQPLIFNRFVQADSSISRHFGGTGLGLPICKSLAELMGGGIEIVSTPGKGSTFIVRLVLETIDPTLLSAQDTSDDTQKEKQTLPPNSNILIAEDNEINQEIISSLLEDMNLRFTIVSDGEAAVQALEEETYNLVLMDMHMPKLDGIQATRLIRKKNIDTPIIALTANAMNTDKERCFDAGMNDHLSKPINPDLLFNTIHHWLTRRVT